jgi:hypothetical protein
MSIGSISSTTMAQATDNGAKVQLEREQRKAGADTQVEAGEAAATAATGDAGAGRAVEGTLGTTVDMYL